jgi:indolepyruvate decarboxylase
MGQTVIQYVLSRLKDLGVTATFGCPGDFVYPVCDAICDDPDISGIWCANELNASYAAEGYARTKGVGVVVSTYGPGELSTFCGLGGAHGENVKVVSLTGMPGLSEWKGYRTHHMIADQPPNYDLFVKMVSPLTAGGDSAAVITPENCVFETERLIAAMLYHSKPINLAFPRDVPDQPVIMPDGELEIPLANPQSDPDALDAVVREIVHRVTNAKQACILPGYLLRRYDCVAEAKAMIEASGLPFVSSLQDKGVLPEGHPQFAGVYLGRWAGLADPGVTEFVESSDCIIGLGPENHEFNNAFHTMQYDFKETMNIMPHRTRVGMATYDKVEMKDVLTALAQRMPNRNDVTGLDYRDSAMKLGTPSGKASDAISYEPMFERFQTFFKPNDILVSDTSVTAICANMRLNLPDDMEVEAGASWGSIGWGTPEILGNCIAAPDRRCVIIAGEGGHQMTANEMGTFYRYGAKPIFLTVNNGGYFAERVTNRYPDEEYNDLAQWNFADVPAVMGCKDWYTAKVTTLGELDAALAEAENTESGVYVEIIVDPWLCPQGGEFLFTGTGALFGMPDRTWEGWLKEMAAKQK